MDWVVRGRRADRKKRCYPTTRLLFLKTGNCRPCLRIITWAFRFGRCYHDSVGEQPLRLGDGTIAPAPHRNRPRVNIPRQVKQTWSEAQSKTRSAEVRISRCTQCSSLNIAKQEQILKLVGWVSWCSGGSDFAEVWQPRLAGHRQE
jgi:hypothetical protein